MYESVYVCVRAHMHKQMHDMHVFVCVCMHMYAHMLHLKSVLVCVLT